MDNASGSGTYYDNGPDGSRVATLTAGSVSAEYLYGFDGNMETIVDQSGDLFVAGIYAAGLHVADYWGYTLGGTTEFRFQNPISSTLSIWSPTGANVTQCEYEPYGEDLECSSYIDYAVDHFTDMKRDAVSGLDIFRARDYSSSLGRFMSPDPSGAAFSDPSNPQSWNMYSYVQNNPLSAVDPDGLDCVYINNDTGGYEGFNSGDCDNSTTASANSGYYFDGTVNTIYTTTGDTSGQVVGVQGTSDETGGDLYDANPAGLSFAQPNSSVSTSGMNTTIDTFGNFSETTQFNHGTHPFRDNNAGDIVSGGFVNRHGAIGADGRFGVFASAGGGKAALDALLHSPAYSSLSVNAAVARYAPAFENNTVGYQQFLLNVVGVGGGTPVSSLSASQMSALENGIARYEGASASGNYSISVTSNF